LKSLLERRNQMLLKSLKVEREHSWKNPPTGKLQGEIEFADQQGLVKFNLTEDDAVAILKLCATRILERVRGATASMIQKVVDDAKLIENKEED